MPHDVALLVGEALAADREDVDALGGCSQEREHLLDGGAGVLSSEWGVAVGLTAPDFRDPDGVGFGRRGVDDVELAASEG